MKLRNRLLSYSAVLAVVAAVACASGGSARLYQRELGNATSQDLTRVANQLILRFHYEIAEYDTVPFIRWETYWRQRPPFRDELELGITSAESRLIVIGRSRSESEVTTYSTRLTVENRVRVAGGADWSESVNTPMFRAYADSIAEEFRKEFANIGVRRGE